MTTLLIKEKYEFKSGVHTWKVKVHKSCSLISIGVCEVGKATGWWYCSTGWTADNTAAKVVQGPQFEDFSSMDFIAVRLDLDARQVSFSKNDQPPALAFKALPALPLCPAAKITGLTVTRKDVQFIHADGGCTDVESIVLEPQSPEPSEPPPPCAGPSGAKKKSPGCKPEARPGPAASRQGVFSPPPRPPPEGEKPPLRGPEVAPPRLDKASSTDDAARPKPAWVNAAGRLLHNKTSSSLCRGHGPLFKTKKGACSRCECLPCPECVHAFQNIRDTLLAMLTKAQGDGPALPLQHYSLMFTGLKKNGDVKVDVHHRCCSKHKQRFISSLTINTCCRKHKVETCERIVQTLKENARTSRASEARHELGGDDFTHDMDEIETDDMEDEDEEEYEDDEHDDLEDEESSATSGGSRPVGEAPPGRGGAGGRTGHPPGRAKAKGGGRRHKKRGKR